MKTNIKKIASIFFVLLLLASLFTTTALASDTAPPVRFVPVGETAEGLTVSVPTQRWTYTRSITNGLVINSTSATMPTLVETYGGYQSSKISVTSTLQRKSGSSWVNVGSPCSGSGTGFCSYENTVTLSANQIYRVVTTGTTTYGGKSESITATSRTYST